MKLEPHGVGRERPARQPRPFDRALAFLDPLLARAALVVERDHALGRAAHVRHDEANPGIKLARMPLDLGNHAARLAPACRLVGEARVVTADFVWGAADRGFEQGGQPGLQDLGGGPTDRVFDVLSLQVLVDAWHGECGIGPEIVRQTLPRYRRMTGLSTPSQPSALCTLPGRKAQRSRSPN